MICEFEDRFPFSNGDLEKKFEMLCQWAEHHELSNVSKHLFESSKKIALSEMEGKTARRAELLGFGKEIVKLHRRRSKEYNNAGIRQAEKARISLPKAIKKVETRETVSSKSIVPFKELHNSEEFKQWKKLLVTDNLNIFKDTLYEVNIEPEHAKQILTKMEKLCRIVEKEELLGLFSFYDKSLLQLIKEREKSFGESYNNVNDASLQSYQSLLIDPIMILMIGHGQGCSMCEDCYLMWSIIDIHVLWIQQLVMI